MQNVVVAAKVGAVQPWVARATAELAEQTGAVVWVVCVDEVEMEALTTLPRSEHQAAAQRSADQMAEQIRAAGVEATATTRPGKAVSGILLFAEEHDADVIMVGASTRGRVAHRILGAVPLELVQRSRRPVLIVPAPDGA